LLPLLPLPIDSAEWPSYVWEIRLLLARRGDILVRYQLSTCHFFLILFPRVELDMGDYRSARRTGYGFWEFGDDPGANAMDVKYMLTWKSNCCIFQGLLTYWTVAAPFWERSHLERRNGSRQSCNTGVGLLWCGS